VENFYSELPLIPSFSDAARHENHVPLPDGWVIGFTDVVGSTNAIESGRYKAVNMVGAGVIAAITNSIGRRPFPFVFGGDGASFAVSAADAEAATYALQAMASYSETEFGLKLRIAITDVSSIRAAGKDVCVARYEASPDCVYAMFSGGGLSWFGEQVKAGKHQLDASCQTLPDLSGLTCRWGLSPARHGVILSSIIAPLKPDSRFSILVEEIISSLSTLENSGNPVAMGLLQPGPTSQAIELEALVKSATSALRWQAWIKSALLFSISYVAFLLRPKIAGRDMNLYMESLVTNADFRKFDDFLYLTLDCSLEFAAAFEQRLQLASEYTRYGVFRQSSALLTCYVISNENIGRPVKERANRLAHIHFIDGASGGYAMAAKAMKMRSAQN
jgi:hypothetical protein